MCLLCCVVGFSGELGVWTFFQFIVVFGFLMGGMCCVEVAFGGHDTCTHDIMSFLEGGGGVGRVIGWYTYKRMRM